MSIAEKIEPLTIEEYIRLYELTPPFEIINGERREIMPPVALHGLILRALFRLLDTYCIANKLGEVVMEMPFVLTYDSGWVKGALVPELLFFAAARWDTYTAKTPDWPDKPFLLAPDLVAEIVSPNDLYSEIQDKVDRYLAVGVKLIWIIDPQRRRVVVYTTGHYALLGATDTLTGGDFLPGFSVALGELFQAAQVE